MRAESLLAALQLGDSLFPSGGFTLSHGLETLAELGLVSDASDARAVDQRLGSLAGGDLRWRRGGSGLERRRRPGPRRRDRPLPARHEARPRAPRGVAADRPPDARDALGHRRWHAGQYRTRSAPVGAGPPADRARARRAGSLASAGARRSCCCCTCSSPAALARPFAWWTSTTSRRSASAWPSPRPSPHAADAALAIPWKEMYACAVQTELMTMIHERATMRLFAS